MAKDNKAQARAKRRRRKKLTCCQRCRRRICRWFYRRTKRCFKKAVFGSADPRLSDYEIAGVNLADAKDTLRRNTKKSLTHKLDKKHLSVTTLYKNKKKSTISLPFKDKLKQEFDDISLIKPDRKFLKPILEDLKERNLYIGLSKDSNLNITKSDKKKFDRMAKEYETKYKKQNLLNHLEKHKSSYLRNYDDKYKNVSFLDLKELENMDKDKMKKKLSITSSKRDVLKTMLSDYEKKKFSLTGMFSKSKPNLDKLNKEDVKKIIEAYKEKNKLKSNTFIRQSKIKQLKSDLRAKLAGIHD